ncbi:MAG: crossover junction endodeoxyribonuclease RuvC [Halothiobacillaceae bacterium]|nr:crossover junction endodeoxyribonuclease RuvC [Halothiobacillaceae bacterium]MDY0049282.1 crossover junction endodeoxyribonuclease RuvC [Halothiobacillaceae bacterium]
MSKVRILGIDPGSVTTGVAVIELRGREPECLYLDSLRLNDESGFTGRLGDVFTRVSSLVESYVPNEVAIEQVFMFRSPESSLKLAQARGAAIAACVTRGLPVHEYMPAEVKQSVVGTGRAAKEQVQHMVRQLLKLSAPPPADGADAAAIALCHAFRRSAFSGARQALDKEADGLRAENLRLLAQSRFRRRSR